MIIFAAFGIFVEVWFSFLVKQRSVFSIVGPYPFVGAMELAFETVLG